MVRSEEEWKSLNGCNACINTKLCDNVGNCVLLTIDKHFPDNVKKKRRLISRLRTYQNDHQLTYLKEMICENKGVGVEVEDVPTIRLTLIEKMFIESLNKKR